MNANLYRDPRWQKLRLEKLTASNWKCDECDDESSELHVHHRQYRPSAEGPWDYTLAELQSLCSYCHREIYIRQDLDRSLARFSSASSQAPTAIAIHWLFRAITRLQCWWIDREGIKASEAKAHVTEILALIVQELEQPEVLERSSKDD